MKEWEQEAHASDSSIQESEYRWEDPSTWSWSAHGLSDRDREIFVRLTRAESGDESESLCEPYCAPKPVDSDYVPMAHTNLWTTDGIHLVIHHLSLLVYLPRRSRLGNRIRMRMHQRALGYSEDVNTNQTDSQQACHWSLSHLMCHHRRNELYLRLSIPSTMGSHQTAALTALGRWDSLWF